MPFDVTWSSRQRVQGQFVITVASGVQVFQVISIEGNERFGGRMKGNGFGSSWIYREAVENSCLDATLSRIDLLVATAFYLFLKVGG